MVKCQHIMPVQKSKAYFHGKEGYNCAQAIAAAFSSHETPELDELVRELAASGGGRAADGVCGALYAAQTIAGPEIAFRLEAGFVAEIGAPDCRTIKRQLHVPCLRCVETAARLLHDLRKDA